MLDASLSPLTIAITTVIRLCDSLSILFVMCR